RRRVRAAASGIEGVNDVEVRLSVLGVVVEVGDAGDVRGGDVGAAFDGRALHLVMRGARDRIPVEQDLVVSRRRVHFLGRGGRGQGRGIDLRRPRGLAAGVHGGDDIVVDGSVGQPRVQMGGADGGGDVGVGTT